MKEMLENRKDHGIIKSDFKINGDQKPGSLWFYHPSEGQKSHLGSTQWNLNIEEDQTIQKCSNCNFSKGTLFQDKDMFFGDTIYTSL